MCFPLDWVAFQFVFCFQIRAEIEMEKDQEKKRAVNVATRSLERDIERVKADHATEIEQLNERHKQEISELKKKQWVRTSFIIIVVVGQF